MSDAVSGKLAQILGSAPHALTPLGGGSVANVLRAEMPDGKRFAVKHGAAGARLDLEGWMLGYLRTHSALPVPEVVHAEDRLLILGFIDAGGPIDEPVERDAAVHLAALHSISANAYGLDRDTLIGGLDQPNGWEADWLVFFRDRRLLHMAREAHDAGRLDGAIMARIEALAERLERWITPPPAPSLIHGDMWGGNVLVKDGRVAGFVDPAIYYGDAEIELAFSTLFGTFGDAFFERYEAVRPLRPGFREARRELYNLYPLLVHVRLFGGAYVRTVDATLARFGF